MIRDLSKEDIEKHIPLFFAYIAQDSGPPHECLQFQIHFVAKILILRYHVIKDIVIKVQYFFTIQQCHYCIVAKYHTIIVKLEVEFLEVRVFAGVKLASSISLPA